MPSLFEMTNKKENRKQRRYLVNMYRYGCGFMMIFAGFFILMKKRG